MDKLAMVEDGMAAYKRGDYGTALKIWRPLAEQGDAKAQVNLGFMNENGQGVPQDFAEAAKWYRKAAEQGNNAMAQHDLGRMYTEGRGVPQDYAEAVKWWRKAAEQDHAGALFNLGHAYRVGEGVPRNNDEALKWWRKAAEQGHATAQANLGRMYASVKASKLAAIAVPLSLLFGGVKQDFVQAHMWFTLAATQGDKTAQEDRDTVARMMTPDQIAEAQHLAREWMAKHPQ